MAKTNIDGKLAADEMSDYEELLWEFVFDQASALTNHLLESQVLRLDQIMHVVQSFVNATRMAGSNQALDRLDAGPSLGQCASDLIYDYWYGRAKAMS